MSYSNYFANFIHPVRYSNNACNDGFARALLPHISFPITNPNGDMSIYTEALRIEAPETTYIYKIDLTGFKNLILTEEIIAFLSKIPYLEALKLGPIADLPQELSQLKLYELNLTGHKMPYLPNFIGEMSSLRVLKLGSGTHSSNLRFSLNKLKNLRFLQISAITYSSFFLNSNADSFKEYLEFRNSTLGKDGLEFVTEVDAQDPNLINFKWTPIKKVDPVCYLTSTQANIPFEKGKATMPSSLVNLICTWLTEKEILFFNRLSEERNSYAFSLNNPAFENFYFNAILQGLTKHLKEVIASKKRLKDDYALSKIESKPKLTEIKNKLEREIEVLSYLNGEMQIDETTGRANHLCISPVKDQVNGIFSELVNDKHLVYPSVPAYSTRLLEGYYAGPIRPSEYVQTQLDLHTNEAAQTIFDNHLINFVRLCQPNFITQAIARGVEGLGTPKEQARYIRAE